MAPYLKDHTRSSINGCSSRAKKVAVPVYYSFAKAKTVSKISRASMGKAQYRKQTNDGRLAHTAIWGCERRTENPKFQVFNSMPQGTRAATCWPMKSTRIMTLQKPHEVRRTVRRNAEGFLPPPSSARLKADIAKSAEATNKTTPLSWQIIQDEKRDETANQAGRLFPHSSPCAIAPNSILEPHQGLTSEPLESRERLVASEPGYTKPDAFGSFFRSLPGFCYNNSGRAAALSPLTALAVKRAFRFPMAPICLSASTEKEAQARASADLTSFLVELARAATKQAEHYPEIREDEDEEAREDHICDFFVRVGWAMDMAYNGDPEWTPGCGKAALGASVMEELLDMLLRGRLGADESDETWSELVRAVDVWMYVWMTKHKRF